MESRRRGKRKSPSQDIIFEVSDDDISAEASDNECNEPEAKILKTDGNLYLISSGDSNLESDQRNLSVKHSPNRENDDAVVIVDCSSVSNDSTLEYCATNDEIIDITADDSSIPNSVSVIQSQTEELEVCSIPVENAFNEGNISNINEQIEEPPSPLKEEDFNLEDGEIEEVQNNVDDLEGSKTQPCICITFSNESIAGLYKFKFLKFIQSFVELEVENFEGLKINVQKDSTLNPNEWVVLDETIGISEVKEFTNEESLLTPPPSQEKSPSPKKKKKKKNKKERDLFVLDNNPSVDENNGLCTKYCTKFQIDRSEKSTEDESEIKISAQTCFNCDNNHAIKDCPLPKNFAKINAARQRFKAQKQTSRYHLEEDQKYGHLIPGIISNNLREALGLRKNQLPPFIYHMRTLGYPPGWLEEAKFLHSNLEMFDTEGNNVRALTKKKQGLDPDKIINYPGFNVPVPKDVKDENRQYRVPPFSEKFSKQAMIDFFEKQYTKDQDDFETCDMDLDASFEENKEKNDIKIVVEKVMIVNPVLSELKDIDSNLPSPSLIDLEKEKENLLAALEDNTSCNPKSVEIAGEEPEKSDCEVISDIEKSQITEVSLDENLLIDIEKAKDSSTSLSSPPISSGLNTVKNSSFGTPILKSNSPYSRLPNPDNFMKDVSPVINFENLPNSTGKYEQMTEVLQKVRSTLRKNLQNCKS